MKKSLLLIISIGMLHNLFGQKIGAEHYFSYTTAQTIRYSALIFIEHSHFIAEIEHECDAPGAFSVNVGRSFSFGNERASTLIEPMIGFRVGPIGGINLNLDQEIELNSLYISTRFDYFFSPRYKSKNYFYTWVESGICFSEKFYGGFSLQADVGANGCDVGKGFVLGFSSGKWTFPLYVFNPVNCQKNIVAGILYNINFQKPQQSHSGY